MGSERILEDLLVLKTKILEVFENLMACENFNDSQEEKLFESFNLLEESLSILLTVSSDIKKKPLRQQVENNLYSLVVKEEVEGEIHTEGTPEEPQTPGIESSSRKRSRSASKEADRNPQTQRGEAPAVKRRRGRPRNTKLSNKNSIQEQTEQNHHCNTEITGFGHVLEKRTDPSGVEREGGNAPSEVVQEINADTVSCDSSAMNNPEVTSEAAEARRCSTVMNVDVDVTRKRKGRGRPRKEISETGVNFKTVVPVECSSCDRILCNNDEYGDHKCSGEEQPDTPDEPTYSCDKCNVVFQTKEVMASHMANHKDKVTASCRLCGKTFAFASHLRMHSHGDKGSFRCRKCDEGFTERKLLKLHQALHRVNQKTTEPKTGTPPITVPYKCPVCDVIIKDACNVKRHLDSHGEKNHVCAVCDKRFSRSDHLNDHMKIHSGHRPRICEFCAKGFLNSSDLKRHLRIHTGSKPYTCTVCKRGFTQKCSLNKHMLLHEKKPVAPKPKQRAARSGDQQPRVGGTFTYKHVMRDLGKTPEESGQEQQLYVTDGNSPDVTDQNNANSETSAEPMKAGRTGSNPPHITEHPQLITLLTKQAVSGSLSTDRGHVAPSDGNVKQVPSGGMDAHVLRLDSGATRIILHDGVEVGQEILVYVEKSPAANNTQIKTEQAESAT